MYKQVITLGVTLLVTFFIGYNKVKADDRFCATNSIDPKEWRYLETRDNAGKFFTTGTNGIEKVYCCQIGALATEQLKCDFYIYNGDASNIKIPEDALLDRAYSVLSCKEDETWLFHFTSKKVISGSIENEQIRVCCSNGICDHYVKRSWAKEHNYHPQRPDNMPSDWWENKIDDNIQTGGCDILGENVTPIVRWVFKIIRFLIPLLIIILTMVDFAGVVLSGEDKNFKEVWKKLVKRLLIGVAVIFAPMILTYLIDISGILNQYGIDKNQLFCSIY